MKKNFILIICSLLFCGNICNAQFAGVSSISQTPEKNYNYSSGYKGFVEIGFSIGHREIYNEPKSMWSTSIYTTHGYQFAPYFFLGASMGFEIGTYKYLPIFGECRINILNPQKHFFSPYIGARAGYAALADARSAYFNFFLGIRIPFKNNAFLINAGYQLTGIHQSYHNYDYLGFYDVYYDNCKSFSLRLGYEF